MNIKHVVNFSGGKDSLAMLLLLKKYQAPIDEIIYVHMGDWMWDGALDHIHEIEEKLDVNITVLDVNEQIKEQFELYGWSHINLRWCTNLKKVANNYIKEKYPDCTIYQYVGFSIDEKKRAKKFKSPKSFKPIFPYRRKA